MPNRRRSYAALRAESVLGGVLSGSALRVSSVSLVSSFVAARCATQHVSQCQIRSGKIRSGKTPHKLKALDEISTTRVVPAPNRLPKIPVSSENVTPRHFVIRWPDIQPDIPSDIQPDIDRARYPAGDLAKNPTGCLYYNL